LQGTDDQVDRVAPIHPTSYPEVNSDQLKYGWVAANVLTGSRSHAPARARVTDEQACALPKRPGNWRTLAIPCFKQGDQPIPILDLPRIFGGGLL
jgi:hypothetical protein